MESYEANASIRAKPQTIWAILTDSERYTDWDSGVDRVEGKIARDATIKVFSSVSPGRAFPVKVIELIPDKSMVWSGGMPLGLFKGVRRFTLTPQPNGTTSFDMREEYTGPLLPMIWKSIPNLQPSFDQFVKGLKEKAESTV